MMPFLSVPCKGPPEGAGLLGSVALHVFRVQTERTRIPLRLVIKSSPG